MSKTFWIVGGVIVVLILLALGYYLYWPVSSSKSSDGDGKAKVSLTLNEAVTEITKKECEINALNEKISLLEDQITEKDQQIKDLIATCTGKTKYLPAKNTGGSGNGSGNTGNSGNSGNVKPAKVGNTGNSGEQTQESDAEYLTQQNSVPKSKVRIEINEEKFCIRLGKLFWPHLAVNQGEEFSEIVDNGAGGFDLYLLPQGTVGSNPKGYGITEDYTYWITKSRLSSWSEKPYIMVKTGAFEQAQESGEYWIAK